ncbi:helix-turn-helix domain-containing protein [Oceanobacillus caeni]|uniref:helix-turn-helix domain-containing protein n=1 Tax=Virgibacillus sp. SK37 TaxID=403957 RepID=UPI0011A2B062|nr:helix-turn-helix transcriptional regulator [Virgibacillus sp. SK37]
MIKLKLREKMEAQSLSTAELVKETARIDPNGKGVHRNTVSKLLNGKSNGIQFETLDLFCKALECDLVDLIEFVPDSKD